MDLHRGETIILTDHKVIEIKMNLLLTKKETLLDQLIEVKSIVCLMKKMKSFKDYCAPENIKKEVIYED